METYTQERFEGPEFTPGQKVKLLNVEHNGYDKGPLFKGLDVHGAFTVKAVEQEHRSGTGEHDDIGPYNHQLVELEELPTVKIAADRFELA